uniref:Uncharacterized protein n=1 Tax=Rhizophagus irregularis (strain DAOM 181602 / DAOM 197198 / MUCL 43194) TaxID=747089 RepID=U9SPL6_RHIID
MNPTIITSKPIVIVASEITEKPDGNPTNSCSIMSPATFTCRVSEYQLQKNCKSGYCLHETSGTRFEFVEIMEIIR